MGNAIENHDDKGHPDGGSSGSGGVAVRPSGGSVGPGGGDPARGAVAVADEGSALLALIERVARDPTVDIDRMERLLQMQQQVVDRHAKTAFLAAFAKLQSELPAAARKGTGHNAKKYARFEDVMEAIRPHLARHGFSLSHRINTDGNVVRVTGVLGHCDGHSEQTEMVLPPDTSGGKTAVHAMGSSISYGKRYVTLTLTGIATEDDDDGKKATAGVTITDEQAEAIKAALDVTEAELPRFCKYWKLEKLTDLPAAQYEAAMTSIQKAAQMRGGVRK